MTKKIIMLILVIVFSSTVLGLAAPSKVHPELLAEINAPRTMAVRDVPMANILAQVEDDNSLSAVSELITEKGGSVTGEYKIGDVVSASVPLDKIISISEDLNVEYIWPVQEVELFLDESAPQIGAPELWSKGYGGSGVKIAIIDTGIDEDHPDFAGRILLQGDVVPAHYYMNGKDYGDGDDDDVAEDEQGHGTHCAGIAAGAGETYRGIAPEAWIMPVKVFAGSTTLDQFVIEGINWAVDPNGDGDTSDGADVISMSLGSEGATDGPLNDAVRDAIAAGKVVVIASGNKGYNVAHSPGNTEEAITVGAVTKADVWAEFSSGYDYGDYIKPDVVAPGQYIVSTLAQGTDMYGDGAHFVGDYYYKASGTSMATPHVAGAAALLLQINPELGPAEVKYIIEKTAVPLGEPGKDIKYGSGRIDTTKFITSNVNALLKYDLSYPDYVYSGNPVNISVVAKMPNLVERMSSILAAPNNDITQIAFTSQDNVWSALISSTNDIGNYGFQIDILETSGNHTILTGSFEVLPYSQTEGIVEDIIVPDGIEYGSQFDVQVNFVNSGETDLDASVEVIIFKDNLEYTVYDYYENSQETGKVTVGPGENHIFELMFDAPDMPGNYTISAIASYNDNNHVRVEPLNIVDTTPPVIDKVSHEASIIKDGALLVEVLVNDTSSVHGTLIVSDPDGYSRTIDLSPISSIKDQKTLTGTFIDTGKLGAYSFRVEVCDQNTCVADSPYVFVVEDCGGKYVLIVEESLFEDTGTKYAENIEGCTVRWSYPKSGLPSEEYLDNFDGLIWTTGNVWSDSIPDEATSLLIGFGGSILIEGPDVAGIHRYDDLMANLTQTNIKDELNLENDTDVTFIQERYHVLFKNLPGEMEYDSAVSPFPDSLASVGAVQLSSLKGEPSIYAVNTDETRLIFIPFMIDALTNSDDVVKNIGNWITSSDAPDIVLNNISYGYLVEGKNRFTVYLDNPNDISPQVKVRLYLDDLEKQGSINMFPDGYSYLWWDIDNIAYGHHVLKTVVNYDYSLFERNYLNNELIYDIFVAPEEADLEVSDLEYATSGFVNISVSNIGGSDASNVKVELLVDGDVEAESRIAVQKGQTISLTTELTGTSLLHDIEVRLNSDGYVSEFNYSNNELSKTIYLCDKDNLLIVDDNNGESNLDFDASSAARATDLLKMAGYCVTVWDEESMGVPYQDYLYDFDVVLWLTGDHFKGSIDEQDMQIISDFNGKLLIEGADIAYDHSDDNFVYDTLHSTFHMDLVVDNETELVLGDHHIFDGISGIDINRSLASFPDVLIAENGYGLANWSDYGAAVIGDDNFLYFGFSFNQVGDDGNLGLLLSNSMEWLTRSQEACLNVSCDDYCDDYTRYYNGVCGYGDCVYDLEYYSAACGFKEKVIRTFADGSIEAELGFEEDFEQEFTIEVPANENIVSAVVSIR